MAISTTSERRLRARLPLLGRPLPHGGTFGVVSPASPVLDEALLVEGRAWLEEAGYAVRLSRHLNARWGYAAGRPEQRADDLEAAFADDEVDVVLCLNGGNTSSQLLPLLDFDLIRANPKPFVGFSDITALHCALGVATGLVTFWGPMQAMLSRCSEFTRQRLLDVLATDEPLGPVPHVGRQLRTLCGGVARGELVGGTTQLLCSLLGTPWEPDTRGKLLLLEDVRRQPCRLDRDLHQLLNAGKLQQCAGIVLSEHTACEPDPAGGAWHGPSLTLAEVLEHTIEPLGIPALYGLPLGHGSDLATIPLGVEARLDADLGTLEICGAALA